MERRQFTQEFSLRLLRLIKERGVSYARASADLGVHPTQLRNWVKQLAEDPQHVPRPGPDEAGAVGDRAAQARGRQTEGRTRYSKKAAAYFAKDRREVRFYCEAPGALAGGVVVRGARCLAGWILCLADTTAQSAQPPRRGYRREGSCQLPCERPDLWRQRVWHDLLAEGISCGLHRSSD